MYRTLTVSYFILINGFAAHAAVFDITAFGAKGDGLTQDRASITNAINAAAASGGGTVEFPAGRWLTGSIQMQSNVTLHLDRGASIEASADASAYDPPEPNPWDKYQDFGHSHFHNSLIWGENLHNIAIEGGGLISGKALTRGERGTAPDKTIALKLCHNVTLRDFSIAEGGHFGILATGVDNLTIDNVLIDTNRDGIDIDSCRNVRISNSSINSPNDDAITLKGTHALGAARPTENITITNCMVSGFEIGSLLDGTYKHSVQHAPDRDGPTGRIKIGTESEGDFRNITISNIVFDTSRGLALESVDGANISDVAVSNITMRNVSNSPIFIRLGSRMRAPEATPVGSIQRISISNVLAYDVDPRYPALITGIPGHDVRSITLRGFRVVSRGGLSLENVAKQSPDLVNPFFYRASGGVPPREPYETPERSNEYPEPSMFGILPAYGFFIRHATGIELNDVDISYLKEDHRPAYVLQDVDDIQLNNCKVQKGADVPALVMMQAKRVSAFHCLGVADFESSSVPRQEH
jgi:polygalacturonase